MIKWYYRKSNYTNRGLQVKSKKNKNIYQNLQKTITAFLKKQNCKNCSMCCHANITNKVQGKARSDTHYSPITQLTHLVNADIVNPVAALRGSSLPFFIGVESQGQETTGQRPHPLLMNSSQILKFSTPQDVSRKS